jgi:pimeloyl-ACP methyl ester carboxylesterase
MGVVARIGAGVLGTAATLSASCQLLSEAVDRRRVPPPGWLVDIGGAGHFVHQDDPGLVVQALRETVARAS